MSNGSGDLDVATIFTSTIISLIALYSIVNFCFLWKERTKVTYLFLLDKGADLIIRIVFVADIFLIISPSVRMFFDNILPFLSFYLSIILMAAFALAYIFSLMLKLGFEPKRAIILNISIYTFYCLYMFWSFHLEMFAGPNEDWLSTDFQPDTPLQYWNTYVLNLLIISPLLFSLRYYFALFQREVNSLIRVSFVFLLTAVISTALFFALGCFLTLVKQFKLDYPGIISTISQFQTFVGLLAAVTSFIHVLGKVVIYRGVKTWQLYAVRQVQYYICKVLEREPERLPLLATLKSPGFYLTKTTVNIFDSIRLLRDSSKPSAKTLLDMLTERQITEGTLEESTAKLVSLRKSLPLLNQLRRKRHYESL